MAFAFKGKSEKPFKLFLFRSGAVRNDSRHGAVEVRDWYFIAEQPAPVPHLAHPERYAALRIVLVTVPHFSRSCEHFPDGFDLHLLLLGVTYDPTPST